MYILLENIGEMWQYTIIMFFTKFGDDRMFTNALVTPATIGKRRRLTRILGATGKGVIIPVDDNLISQNNIGLQDLQKKLQLIELAKPNAILCYYGAASLVSDYCVPLIVNITASTVQSHHTRKVLISSVRQAVSIDAAAVAVHINISSKYESEMIKNLGVVAEACNHYGMPLLAITYPRREIGDQDENYPQLKEKFPEKYAELVAHCVRIAFDLGADMIKTQYTGNADSFSQVVAAANNRPVFIAGGPMMEEKQLYTMVEGAIRAGASGVSIGRNVFNRSNSAEIIENIRKIIFAG